MKTIITINDDGMIPAGTIIDVLRETKNLYYGYWSSAIGTYKISVKKSNCETYNQQKHKSITDQIMEFIRNNPDDPTIKAGQKRLLKAIERCKRSMY